VVATPKPRLIKLEIGSGGEQRFSTDGEQRTAWILGGDAPAFVRSELPFYGGARSGGSNW
jgi:hypothetical protein